MSSRIIGMHHDQRPRSWCDCLLHRVEINLPAMVVNQRITSELHVLNVRKKIEQRIARCGNEDFVARIAQQLNNDGEGFARVGGWKNAVIVNWGAALALYLGTSLRGEARPRRAWST